MCDIVIWVIKLRLHWYVMEHMPNHLGDCITPLKAAEQVVVRLSGDPTGRLKASFGESPVQEVRASMLRAPVGLDNPYLTMYADKRER